MGGDDLSIQTIEQARERIAGRVRRTPLVSSETLSQQLGTNVYLKLELFQKTGSFKVRGAFNKILSLPDQIRIPGVVAVSGGGHAQAVAYAVTSLGLKSVLLMAEKTPVNQVEATPLRDAAMEEPTYSQHGT